MTVFALSLATAGHAVELNPAAVAYKTPEQFQWRDPTDQVATNQTILYGDPNTSCTGRSVHVTSRSFMSARAASGRCC
jgi:hypothetical protein